MKKFKSRAKRIAAIVMSAITAFSMMTALPCTVSAAETTESATSGNYEYKKLADGTVEITRYTHHSGEATALQIPSKLDGYKVTSIGNYAFSGCSSVLTEEISIPDGVTNIGEAAFAKLTNVSTFALPNSITNIGEDAFYGCTSLDHINLSDSVTEIGNSAFCYCTSLKSVTIPDKVTEINFNVFGNCKNLRSVHIGTGVKSIETSAFSNCTSLQQITIPDNVTSIGAYAFENCTSMVLATISKNTTTIEDYAFGYSYDPDSKEFIKHDYFVVYGYSGTAAETYANNNGFKFHSLVCKGDVNDDGTVNIKDATLLQQAIVGIKTLTDTQSSAGDVDGDGRISITDVTLIQKYVARLISSFAASSAA